ncbi:hypothetical protein [Aeoliella sp. SH292]|uniref:hypothetical protein n=1 Tax=Aeoliella sp. SH292 TaxID=3454464 RepID=UPI003F970016
MKDATYNYRLAFTSVEVLAATTLASALMVAVLGILAGVAKKERILDATLSSPPWHDHLTRQLERDLRHARTLKRQGGRLILVGHAGSVNAMGQRSWLPVEIHYYGVHVKSDTLLFRQEYSADGLSSPSAPELMVQGASRLEIGPGTLTTVHPSNTTPIMPIADGVLPSRLQVAIYGDYPDNANSVIYLRSFVLY